jgi:L-iditol 2-dehydrogenase
MRVARLHGLRDLRVEQLDDPQPGPGELLVRVEACGVCPTDVRKFLIGMNDGDYPFNPGHEWVGRVEMVGQGVDGWTPGQRVYGDTYGGYAELATLAVEPGPWSYGALRIDDDLPLERAVFVEPLADCLHALHDQAHLARGERVLVIGAGQMGLQLAGSAAAAEARVTVAEPLEERRLMAAAFGAAAALEELPDGEEFDVVVLSVGLADLVARTVELAAPGGRVVLFAGFGDRPDATLDVNRLHYREVALVGSEWIGTPPNARPERYEHALRLLQDGALPVERLITMRCGLEGLDEAFAEQQARRGLKTLLVPGERT